MKCMPQKQFHLSPNEAFTDTVGKLWCNKLLPANINEICSLIAKQVNPSMTVFHDQVRGEHSSQSLMQQEGSSDKLWLAGEITYGSFRMKMLFPGGMKKKSCVLLPPPFFLPLLLCTHFLKSLQKRGISPWASAHLSRIKHASKDTNSGRRSSFSPVASSGDSLSILKTRSNTTGYLRKRIKSLFTPDYFQKTIHLHKPA